MEFNIHVNLLGLPVLLRPYLQPLYQLFGRRLKFVAAGPLHSHDRPFSVAGRLDDPSRPRSK